MKKLMKNKKLLIAVTIVLLLVLAGIIAYAVIADRAGNVENAGSSDHAKREVTYLEHDGAKYKLKRNIDTLLILGTDNYLGDNEENGWFYNYDQADFFVVLVLDNENETVSAIQLNRDTICEVPWLDVIGQVGGTVTEHLALAHTYGSGGADSCENTVNAVEMLIYNAPIDNYVAFTMDAVPIVNDMVGGVTVTVETDMTATDSTLVKGETVTLMGQHALNFARARMALGDEDNEARLSRQKQYLESFIAQARKAMEEDGTIGLKIFNDCAEYITTDYTATQFSDITQKLDKYEYTGMVTPGGIDKMGEQFNEFYVDDSLLWAAVKNAFCRQ